MTSGAPIVDIRISIKTGSASTRTAVIYAQVAARIFAIPLLGSEILFVQHKKILGLLPRKPVQAAKVLSLRQSDYPGGIQVWGSNAAIIWSSEKAEEEGIHVHAYKADGEIADPDDTFSAVEIDGVRLDPAMVRTLMAQNSLPHLEARVVPLKCSRCDEMEFSSWRASLYSGRRSHLLEMPGRTQRANSIAAHNRKSVDSYAGAIVSECTAPAAEACHGPAGRNAINLHCKSDVLQSDLHLSISDGRGGVLQLLGCPLLA